MTQVEREDIEEKMVAEELRTGYLYRDKVLRPSLVSVSAKPQIKLKCKHIVNLLMRLRRLKSTLMKT